MQAFRQIWKWIPEKSKNNFFKIFLMFSLRPSAQDSTSVLLHDNCKNLIIEKTFSVFLSQKKNMTRSTRLTNWHNWHNLLDSHDYFRLTSMFYLDSDYHLESKSVEVGLCVGHPLLMLEVEWRNVVQSLNGARLIMLEVEIRECHTKFKSYGGGVMCRWPTSFIPDVQKTRKPACDTCNFFLIGKNYIHFSYPKCDRVRDW